MPLSPLPARSRTWLWADVPAQGSRMPGLDVLRGLLALCVMLYHLSVWNGLFPIGTRTNTAWCQLGNYGVSAFFVLSGFLLFRLTPWTSIHPGTPGQGGALRGVLRYWASRWLRLAPVFYLAVACNVVLHLGMGPQASPRFILENLTLSFGAIHPNHALVTGGWYVGLVALLYAAYPLLAWLRHHLGWPFILVFTGALAAWSLPATLHGVSAAKPEWFHAYVQPPNQLFLFGLGALLAEAHARIPARLAWPATLALAAVGTWLLLFSGPVVHDHADALVNPLRYRMLGAVVLVVGASAWMGGTGGPVTRLLGHLGTWSYGSYLFHPVVNTLLQPWLSGWARTCVCMVLTLVIAWALARWVEAPAARLGRRKPAC